MHFDAQGVAIRWGLKQTAQPGSEPFTVSEAKLFLRAGDAEDALIGALITAARKRVERDTRRALIEQTWEFTLDGIPARGEIFLPIAPVSVVSLSKFDDDNVATIVSSDVYRLDTHSLPPRLVLNDGETWPTVGSVRSKSGLIATLTCGYGAAYTAVTDVELLHAVRVLLAHWYENRSAVEVDVNPVTVPLAYEYLISPLIVPFGVVA